MFVMMWECVSCRMFFIESLDECCTIHTRINHLKSSCLFAIGMHMLSFTTCLSFVQRYYSCYMDHKTNNK